MTETWLSREIALIGEEKTKKLAEARIIIFGIGGVGSYALEALARAGVGCLISVDGDRISESNINRQLIADTSTVGEWKAEVACRRVKLINPSCEAEAVLEFADGGNTERIISQARPDFIIDAIDCVPTKLLLAKYAAENGIGIISSMGTGNKLDPTRLKISDISKTEVCPLARAVRQGLRRLGINHLPVVFSTEPPVRTGQSTPASISFVPSVAGLMMAGYAVNEIIK